MMERTSGSPNNHWHEAEFGNLRVSATTQANPQQACVDDPAAGSPNGQMPTPRLLDLVRTKIRLKHYSIRTEQA